MNLTASEMCSIIIACKEAGVSSLKINGDKIDVAFGTKPIVVENTPVPKPIGTETEEKDFIPMTFKDRPTEQVVQDLKDDIEELQISDPARYEELLGQGELVNDDRNQENT